MITVTAISDFHRYVTKSPIKMLTIKSWSKSILKPWP